MDTRKPMMFRRAYSLIVLESLRGRELTSCVRGALQFSNILFNTSLLHYSLKNCTCPDLGKWTRYSHSVAMVQQYDVWRRAESWLRSCMIQTRVFPALLTSTRIRTKLRFHFEPPYIFARCSCWFERVWCQWRENDAHIVRAAFVD